MTTLSGPHPSTALTSYHGAGQRAPPDAAATGGGRRRYTGACTKIRSTIGFESAPSSTPLTYSADETTDGGCHTASTVSGATPSPAPSTGCSSTGLDSHDDLTDPAHLLH